MRRDLSVGQWNCNPQLQILGLAHVQADQLALQRRADHARRRLERELFRGPGHPAGVTRKTTRAVAAHLRFAAVRIIVTHAEIRAVRRAL
jgi:hypothetical protein